MERERKRDMGRTQPAGALDGEGSQLVPQIGKLLEGHQRCGRRRERD